MSERPPLARTRLHVRSYELDGFGHLNHAVHLQYLEHARFEALAAQGVPPDAILNRGEAFHVVRIEIDYRAELSMGDEIEIRTHPHAIRNSSLTFRQVIGAPDGDPRIFAEALVTVVWIGADGRPMRIPEYAREVLT